MKKLGSLALALGVSVALGACAPKARRAPAQPAPPPRYGGQPYGAPSPYGPPGYGQPPPGAPPYAPPGAQRPPPAASPPAPAPRASAPARPLLPPLIGVAAQQQELRNVLAELVASLSPQNQALVRGIPLVFDPTEEVNAYAGCDHGAPFLAATAGILEAVDAIAQTKATDEMFGTQTYAAYSRAVLPSLSTNPNARAALPAGIIPANLGPDPRRWSRAHEMYDELLAFTFGHELAHHYLGHTGCANGQAPSAGPDPAELGRLLTIVPLFNQAAEAAADSAGTINALDAGRARRPKYEWNEEGGVYLLDYFADIEKAAGVGGPLSLLSPVQFLRTHPNPLARIPLVQTVARTWHLQHG